MKYNKIAVIGMMGSGKTTISKLLAEKTAINLYDSDEIFTRKFGEIKEYFANFGETSFREKETEILKEISKNKSFIISCGGGIILSKTNRDILFGDKIFTIYLDTTAEEIFKRLEKNSSRPLLETKDKLTSIKNIISDREKYYGLANLKITTDFKTPEKIVQEIINFMKD